jgi:hypothetical protein
MAAKKHKNQTSGIVISMGYKTKIRGFYLLIVLFGFSGVLKAAPEIQIEAVITGLDNPVAITHAGDGSGRLFITQLSGQILMEASVAFSVCLFIQSIQITDFSSSTTQI